MASRLRLRPIIDSPSLKDRIYEVLKEGITSMDIYAVDADLRLDERGLADQMNISRTPVREALARLEQEGLVTILPRRGVFIARKTVQEILEMIIAWAALESMAARLATERASDDELASLREFVDGGQGAIDEYSQRNIAFHQRILVLSRCGLLASMASGLFLHMRAIRARTMHEGDRALRSIVDHMHIIEALEARDGNLSARLVREHTMNLHDHVARHWVEPGVA